MNRKRRTRPGLRPASRRGLPRYGSQGKLIVVFACVGWCWAYALLGTREHMVDSYQVVASAPYAWGFFALSGIQLAVLVTLGAVLVKACLRAARRSEAVQGSGDHKGGQSAAARRMDCQPRLATVSRAANWLLAAYLIPLLDLLRAAGVSVPETFLEPIFLSLVSGVAVGELAACLHTPGRDDTQDHRDFWLLGVWGLAVIAAIWFYWQSDRAYQDFMLGYHDFGHFARRVVNTWNGRGFLVESPGTPTFWDHFNPGIAILAPFWGIWPDARLFFVVQAICLALPTVLVFHIARLWGVDRSASAAWAAAYLMFPATSQLNLSFSYGWHPVSLAIPLLFGAICAVLRRRFWMAVILVVTACSFKESVIVAVGCFAAAMALQRWLTDRAKPLPADGLLARHLPTAAWLLCWLAATTAFLLIYKLTPFGQFQTERFSSLGDSPLQILAAPLLRPRTFWDQVASPAAAYFVLVLSVPLGITSILRGWRIVIAGLFPLLVLLAWNHPPAKCFAFQYASELIVVVTVSAIGGAACLGCQHRASAAAFASALVATAFLGAWPWSGGTTNLAIGKTYPMEGRTAWHNPRARGTDANCVLRQVLAQVDHRDAAVLASGRIASHLLRVRRLESVDQAFARWETLRSEAGPDRSPVELFDWIVLDLLETFQQSKAQTLEIRRRSLAAGYIEEECGHGIVLLKRPSTTLDALPTAGGKYILSEEIEQ